MLNITNRQKGGERIDANTYNRALYNLYSKSQTDLQNITDDFYMLGDSTAENKVLIPVFKKKTYTTSTTSQHFEIIVMQVSFIPNEKFSTFFSINYPPEIPITDILIVDEDLTPFTLNSSPTITTKVEYVTSTNDSYVMLVRYSLINFSITTNPTTNPIFYLKRIYSAGGGNVSSSIFSGTLTNYYKDGNNNTRSYNTTFDSNIYINNITGSIPTPYLPVLLGLPFQQNQYDLFSEYTDFRSNGFTCGSSFRNKINFTGLEGNDFFLEIYKDLVTLNTEEIFEVTFFAESEKTIYSYFNENKFNNIELYKIKSPETLSGFTKYVGYFKVKQPTNNDNYRIHLASNDSNSNIEIYGLSIRFVINYGAMMDQLNISGTDINFNDRIGYSRFTIDSGPINNYQINLATSTQEMMYRTFDFKNMYILLQENLLEGTLANIRTCTFKVRAYGGSGANTFLVDSFTGGIAEEKLSYNTTHGVVSLKNMYF